MYRANIIPVASSDAIEHRGDARNVVIRRANEGQQALPRILPVKGSANKIRSLGPSQEQRQTQVWLHTAYRKMRTPGRLVKIVRIRASEVLQWEYSAPSSCCRTRSTTPIPITIFRNGAPLLDCVDSSNYLELEIVVQIRLQLSIVVAPQAGDACRRW